MSDAPPEAEGKPEARADRRQKEALLAHVRQDFSAPVAAIVGYAELLIEDAPFIAMYYDDVVRLVSKEVSGLTTNPMNLLNLKRVKKASR